jgi:hypothetical protein
MIMDSSKKDPKITVSKVLATGDDGGDGNDPGGGGPKAGFQGIAPEPDKARKVATPDDASAESNTG